MKKYLLLFAISTGFFACTDLEEERLDNISQETAAEILTADKLLTGTYESLRAPLMDQNRLFCLQEHTSDECIGPTRGGDWDDNGVWRVLHDHTWNAEHEYIAETFSQLLATSYAATNMLQFDPSPQQAAEARFLRAFAEYCVLDGWGQVPFRLPGGSLLDDAEVRDARAAIDYIIAEIDAIMNDLPEGDPSSAFVANKDAARVLKMKTLLNKGTYLNRSAPSNETADMQEVVSLADEIINSQKYSLTTDYYSNFSPDNNTASSENIFTSLNQGGVSSGLVRSRWFMTLHYNQTPSSWNGFTTLADFYNSFEDSDIRKGADYPGMTDVSGIRAGLLEGQQFDAEGNPLEDRTGNPLAFTPEVDIRESGPNLEVTGVRVIKYPIDYINGDNADNDLVIYRFADVWLMKAEAMMRMGMNGEALDMVNVLRSARGASELSDLDEAAMLAERGRELYWEGHRRTDLIRFGAYLDAWDDKPASGDERLLFPVPTRSLAANPNLMQNPGY